MRLLDMTLRPEGTPQVEMEPDGTVEVTIADGKSACVTLLLTRAQARALRKGCERVSLEEETGDRQHG